MIINCNACGYELDVTIVNWPDNIDVNPCDHCIKFAKEELLDDIRNGHILFDEIRK